MSSILKPPSLAIWAVKATAPTNTALIDHRPKLVIYASILLFAAFSCWMKRPWAQEYLTESPNQTTPHFVIMAKPFNAAKRWEGKRRARASRTGRPFTVQGLIIST